MTVKELTAEEKLRLICGKDSWHTVDLDGKIPSVCVSDGPVGLRKSEMDEKGNWVRDLPAVAYPALHVLANSWSRECAREMGESLADDCKEQNVDILLAPGVNIKRNPLNGRNFEYFSEDPLLAGTLAYEYIDGLQSKGVGACLKHYYVNNREYNRLDQSSEVDERTLRELYLKPFELACKAKPISAMCAYNRINGVYASENAKGFRILRDEFGFDGAIISDWGAVHDRTASAKAGLDLEMPFHEGNYEKLVADYKAGKITDEEIDACAERVLRLAERCEKMREGRKAERTVEERFAVARKIAEEGIVLLKNEGVLPLSPGQSISVSGFFAAPEAFGKISGGGSAMVQWRGEKFNLADILRKKTGGEVRYTRTFWERGVLCDSRQAEIDAAECDVCIICAGTGSDIESEGYDRGDMRLPQWEEESILRLSKLNPNTVVVLFAGSAVDVSAWADGVAGIVYAGFCGEQGGEAVARVLTGEVNPSGKLSETFPVSYEDVPVSWADNDPCVARYEEGLDVGYRYYDTYDVRVSFPFGFGLSYSEFVYSALKVKASGNKAEVSFTVKNAGGPAGREVSQLYIRPIAAYVHRPAQELKAFTKQQILPGKNVKVKFGLTTADFAYYSTAVDGWRTDDGLYEIAVGASSREIFLRALVKIEGGNISFVKELKDEFAF